MRLWVPLQCCGRTVPWVGTSGPGPRPNFLGRCQCRRRNLKRERPGVVEHPLRRVLNGTHTHWQVPVTMSASAQPQVGAADDPGGRRGCGAGGLGKQQLRPVLHLVHHRPIGRATFKLLGTGAPSLTLAAPLPQAVAGGYPPRPGRYECALSGLDTFSRPTVGRCTVASNNFCWSVVELVASGQSLQSELQLMLALAPSAL